MRIEAFPPGDLPEAAVALRRRVFTEEQQVPEELEWDETDSHAVHYLVWDDQEKPIATARLYEAQTGCGGIGRMAVAASARGGDVGTQLLGRMLEDGLAHYDRFTLSAQQGAVAQRREPPVAQARHNTLFQQREGECSPAAVRQ